VLETAKTPNPTLEKMMESDKNLIRKSSPAKAKVSTEIDLFVSFVQIFFEKKDPSPRAAAANPSPRKLLSPPPAHGSPFARRKEPAAVAAVAAAAPSPSSKAPSTAVFGLPLSRAMEVQRDAHPQLAVPFVVHYLCSQVIALGGQRSEGIFRISIPSDDLDTYSKNFDRGDYRLPQKDPNYPAVLLKHYLRNLPNVSVSTFLLCLILLC